MDSSRLRYIRQIVEVKAPVGRLFRAITSIGGKNGWYYADWLWKLRGFIDKLLGGVGLRGRRHPTEIKEGQVLDFWRVEECQPNRRFKLRAETIVWGQAWLEFEVEPLGPEHSRLVQTAHYSPKGLAGLAYWFSLYSIHLLLFRGLARAIAKKAEAEKDSIPNNSSNANIVA